MKNKAVIRQLLLDNPCSIEALGLNEKQSRLMELLDELEKQIKEKYGDDKTALNLFQRFQDALDDLCFEELCIYFERGINFGVKFGMELAKD